VIDGRTRGDYTSPIPQPDLFLDIAHHRRLRMPNCSFNRCADASLSLGIGLPASPSSAATKTDVTRLRSQQRRPEGPRCWLRP